MPWTYRQFTAEQKVLILREHLLEKLNEPATSRGAAQRARTSSPYPTATALQTQRTWPRLSFAWVWAAL